MIYCIFLPSFVKIRQAPHELWAKTRLRPRKAPVNRWAQKNWWGSVLGQGQPDVIPKSRFGRLRKKSTTTLARSSAEPVLSHATLGRVRHCAYCRGPHSNSGNFWRQILCRCHIYVLFCCVFARKLPFLRSFLSISQFSLEVTVMALYIKHPVEVTNFKKYSQTTNTALDPEFF